MPKTPATAKAEERRIALPATAKRRRPVFGAGGASIIVPRPGGGAGEYAPADIGIILLKNLVPGDVQAAGDAAGNLRVSMGTALNGQFDSVDISGKVATYSAGATWTAATNPTEQLILVGSATKLVKVRRIRVFMQHATPHVTFLTLLRRTGTTIALGGTQTNPGSALAFVQYDTTDPAPTSSGGIYTANPGAVATLVGAARAAKVWVPDTATASTDLPGLPPETGLVWDISFGVNGEKPFVLRSIAEMLAISLNGTAGSSASVMTAEIILTEE